MRPLLPFVFLLAVAASPSQALGPVEFVHGQGDAEYTNFSVPSLDCTGFSFDIQFVVEGDTALVTMQGYNEKATCIAAAQFYFLNPVIVHGSWEEGWEGHAVGAEPPVQHWPVWDIVVDTTNYDRVWLWSWYVDENGREHLFEGFFRIITQV